MFARRASPTRELSVVRPAAAPPRPAPGAAPPNARPTITGGARPAPGSAARDRTPRISAVVRDRETNLTKSNVRVYADGRRKGSGCYDARSDRLFYSPRLGEGLRRVRIEAGDERALLRAFSWRFRGR